jgi:hypothetical protein
MIEELLKDWLLADAKIQKLKTYIADLNSDLADAERESDAARVSVQEELAGTGEYEVNVPGEYCDYKIYFTTPRASIKVISAYAVPDEFCKTERIAKLKEIKEYLDTVKDLPNWATIEMSQPKLTYKIQKKKG